MNQQKTGGRPRIHRAVALGLALWTEGCVLDPGGERRPEILPGRYMASGKDVEAVYDFKEDGSFAFTRTEPQGITITEAGRWEYRYVGPEERYLIESGVTRRDRNGDSGWSERTGLDYRYRILASSRGRFHLDPGESGLPGPLGLFMELFGGRGHVVFERM